MHITSSEVQQNHGLHSIIMFVLLAWAIIQYVLSSTGLNNVFAAIIVYCSHVTMLYQVAKTT